MSKALRKVLKAGEGETIDYKLTIPNAAKIARTLTSFANHLGGTIAVGVRDDRHVIGVDVEEEKFMLDQAANLHADPPLVLSYQVVYLPPEEPEGDEIEVLLVHIPDSAQKPHYVIEKNGDRHLYIRQGDQSLPASQSITHQLTTGTYHPKPHAQPAQVKDPLAKRILQLVAKEPKVTVKIAAKRCNLSERRAQRIMQQMVDEGLLRAHDHEKEVYYTR